MPWSVKKNSKGGWDIIKSDTGKVVGHSDSKEKAQASVRARYANYKPEKISKGKHKGKYRLKR